ncbi:uncharacterized protein KY384_005657 [Bacidia gigantensis]|uniref:uncharacterized protein n=1 Tax=Bacidia gigantensis TaxID=2732470 RepID=UPI001D04645F|nr:uncharacterized protein KY384_005657 [Bacidia gigantensis]KAG8530174.1 hypothetical protein KY384_005657 [Bacidia gigantensis]
MPSASTRLHHQWNEKKIWGFHGCYIRFLSTRSGGDTFSYDDVVDRAEMLIHQCSGIQALPFRGGFVALGALDRFIIDISYDMPADKAQGNITDGLSSNKSDVTSLPRDITNSTTPSTNPLGPPRILTCHRTPKFPAITPRDCNAPLLEISTMSGALRRQTQSSSQSDTWSAPGCTVKYAWAYRKSVVTTDVFAFLDIVDRVDLLIEQCQVTSGEVFRGGFVSLGSHDRFIVEVAYSGDNEGGGAKPSSDVTIEWLGLEIGDML